MPSNTPRPATQGKKVPLWLWIILVLICATGIAFFAILRSSSRIPAKEKLTPQQEEAIFSDIKEDNVKAPEPASSSEPLLPQKASGAVKELMGKGSKTVPDGELANLALHKPATQSSIYGNNSATYGPQIGVDGNMDESLTAGFFHTGLENAPWWQVDLQNVYAISEIRLYNRTQMLPERASTIQVQLSMNGTDWETIYRHDGSIWTRLNVRAEDKPARFVRVQLNEKNYLHLEEIEVYGVKCAESQAAIPSQAKASSPASSYVPTSKPTISDYFPKSGPAGSYVFLKLEKSISDATDTLAVFYNQKELDRNTIMAYEDTVQFVVPQDAQSGDIQLKLGDNASNKVPFSVVSSVTTPLISQPIGPSSVDQIVSYKDEISVTIPPGILDNTRTLSISRVENPPPNSIAPFAETIAFDVSIVGLEQLNGYVEIKMKYDPALLNPEYSAEDQLMVMRWNEEGKFWLPLPYKVDTAHQTVSFRTNHLTINELINVMSGPAIWAAKLWLYSVYVTPEGNFRLLYYKSAIQKDVVFGDSAWPANYKNPLYPIKYKAKTPRFIQDIGHLLEIALKNYVDTYKFKDPTPGLLWGKNPITVNIDSGLTNLNQLRGGGAIYENVWQSIHFPSGYLTDFNNGSSYGTVGHELFHRIEAEYYERTGFLVPHNTWWLEAAAEYAGYRAAWSDKKQLNNLHEKTGSDFLSYPLSTTGVMANVNGWCLQQSYEYAASTFIQFLVEKKGLIFSDMISYVSKGSPIATPLERLNGYNGLVLSAYYKEFAAWSIFCSDSFLERYKISTISEGSEVLPVPKSALVKITFTGGKYSTIDIYKSDKEYARSSKIPKPDRTIGNGDIHEINVSAGGFLYLLATNPGKEDEILNVQAKVIVNDVEKKVALHTFNLKGGYSAKLWVMTALPMQSFPIQSSKTIQYLTPSGISGLRHDITINFTGEVVTEASNFGVDKCISDGCLGYDRYMEISGGWHGPTDINITVDYKLSRGNPFNDREADHPEARYYECTISNPRLEAEFSSGRTTIPGLSGTVHMDSENPMTSTLTLYLVLDAKVDCYCAGELKSSESEKMYRILLKMWRS